MRGRARSAIDVGTASPQPDGAGSDQLPARREGARRQDRARLKWGDPFVFDRGGEEALFLHEQGVPFEVVPGVPAAIAAPAYAGVPVSYPGGGDTITLVRGYEDQSRTPPEIDWASLAHLGGHRRVLRRSAAAPTRARVARVARMAGRDAGGGCLQRHDAKQETISGTIAELIKTLRETPRRAPATLVVGRVVGLRPHLRWYDERPLFGRRVLVTRPRDQAAELVERLTMLGADAIQAPLIRIEPPTDSAPLLAAAATPDAFDWIVFSSGNAAQAFMLAVRETGGDARSLKGPRLCAVGTATADKLRQYGIKVDVIPSEFRAEAVVAAITAAGPVAGQRILVRAPTSGANCLTEQLREAGAVVTDVVAYRTVLDDAPREHDPDVYRLLLDGRIDVVTFASPSAVRSFVKIYGAEPAADLLKNTVVAVIGPVTAEAAKQAGIPVTIQPATYTVAALVDGIVEHYAASGTS